MGRKLKISVSSYFDLSVAKTISRVCLIDQNGEIPPFTTSSQIKNLLGHGQSVIFPQNTAISESEGLFQYGNYYREAVDLRAVVLHFIGAKRVIPAIIGHSKGGNVVLLYASRYHDVHTVVNISGRFDLKNGIEGRLGKNFIQRITKDGFIDARDKTGKVIYRVTKESLVDRLTTEVGPSCSLIGKNCRVLTVHGSHDEIVPYNDAMEFDKLISNHKLHIIEGANHFYTSCQPELASIVVEFIMCRPSQGSPGSRVNQCVIARL